MTLAELNKYEKITIQGHDNPDADAIASGYGLYCYFREQGKEVSFIYGGKFKIQKDNLKIMVRDLHIPIEYIEDIRYKAEGLLITVDCQYGARNVTKFEADDVAIIDHHQREINDVEKSLIRSNIGSCSTIVWDLLQKENFDFSKYKDVQTALYYGLYMDTGQMTEISNPLDRDMRDALDYNKATMRMLLNSNLSMKELEIAGVALIRCIYNDAYRYAVVAAQPCDPNILGLISDLVLQVSRVDVSIVFNEVQGGIKLSVRSCTREVQASHLAAYLTKGIGSGGGHLNKAGGFISRSAYNKFYDELAEETYFSNRMDEYMRYYQIIEAKDYKADITGMTKYRKKKVRVGYVVAKDILPVGTPILIRTLEGDISTTVEEDMYIMIGIQGEVYPIKKEKFEKGYYPTLESYSLKLEYNPTIINEEDGRSHDLIECAKICEASGGTIVYCKELEKGVKVFTAWDDEKYMRGEAGDYLAVRGDDYHDVYVIERTIFEKTYEKVEEEENV